MSLFDKYGHRKYVNGSEREAFRQAAEAASNPAIVAFCLVLLYTGCRISEARYLTIDRLDFANQTIIYETLKKRKRGIYRAVPVPLFLLQRLAALDTFKNPLPSKRLFPWSRSTASYFVKQVMQASGLTGINACPKGLRHGFAIHCLEKSIPLTLISKWLGHSSLTITAIYLNVMGEEERKIAQRLWG